MKKKSRKIVIYHVLIYETQILLHLDHGNEFTAIKIEVGFSEKILNKTEPVVSSIPNMHMKKSYSISCCINTPSQDTVHSQTVITKLSDQKGMPSQLSKLSHSELCDNDHNSYIASYQYAGDQYMEIHHNQPIILNTSKCQCLNELEVPEKASPCTVVNCNMEKSEDSTVNIHDKGNKDAINDINNTIQDIYVRNRTKQLGDSDNVNNMYQTKNRPLTIDADYKEHSKFNVCTNSKISSGIDNDVSNKEIKQIRLCKQNELKDVWKNNDYTYLSDTIMKSVDENAEICKINSQNVHKTNHNLSNNVSCQKEKQVDFDDYISTDIETCNDLQNNTQSSSSDTIVIAFSKPQFKQVLSEIKEHTKSLEKQLESINNIIENITVLSEQKGHLPEKENFTIFYEKIHTCSNESQTDEFVDINNNKEKVIEKNMEGSNLCKICALSTSSLTEKFSVCQEPNATSIDEKLLKNDDTVDHSMQEQCSMFEQISSFVEEKKELPTTEIIADITNHKPDQINTKSAPYTNHKIEQVSLCHSHDKNMSNFKTDQMKSSVKLKTKDNYCDQTDCNTAIPDHSTMKTTVSNHDTIYGLYLETTYTQSSNFQIVAATSASSLKLNSNARESKDFIKSEKSTLRNLTEKSSDKVSPDTLDISTTIDDLNPSISIQCITINLSSCHAHPQTTKPKDTSVRNIHEKVTKSKKNKKFKLRKS
ncbi:SUN domain-containing protein 2-like [Vespula squamosa]|uniref:SUN domain-containing protein 2-like n=1 Tax=Vespula squamosa TaxID=30214 RepID=A0ABD2A5P1_VESSQ